MGKQRKVLWMAVFGALLVCFVGIPVGLRLTKPPLTDSMNCREDGNLPAHTVVLIDQSDPFDETDTEWVWQLIYDEAQSLKKHGKLTVIGINADDPDQGHEVFSRCSPGSPKTANPIFENPRFIKQDWQQRFERQMQANVADLMLKRLSPFSPLIEHFKGIERRSDFRKNISERRIVVISDLYQHSSLYSMYDSGLNANQFDQASSNLEFPKLEGIEFALFRVDRQRKLRGSELISFWKEFLMENGADEPQIIRG